MHWGRCLARAVPIMATASAAFLAPVSPVGAAAPATITTVAGGPGSGPAANVGQQPVAIGAAGSHLWVMDSQFGPGTSWLRTVDTTTGQESQPTFSINYAFGFHPTNPSLAGDSSGDLFIAYTSQTQGGLVVELHPSGSSTVVAGGGSLSLQHVDNVPATAEYLNSLNGMALDGQGDVYLSENTWQDGRMTTTLTDSRVRKVTPNGTITTAADSTGQLGFIGDGGPGQLAELNGPQGLTTDPAGNLYIADTRNGRVRRLDTSGLMTTVAGGGTSTADGVPAILASLDPTSVAFDSQGLIIEDDATARIRRVIGGTISTVAGNGALGFSGDGGPATQAGIAPAGIAATGDGGIDLIQNTCCVPGYTEPIVRRVAPDGTINHYAGSGQLFYGGDGGPALHAQFAPFGHLALDGLGNIYITGDERVRKVDVSGTMTTVAGSGVLAYPHDTGDGGPATQAAFRSVDDVAVGPSGNMYILDQNDFRIRMVDSGGIITTVAGDGIEGQTGDGGPATQAELGNPTGLGFDPSGNLLFGDSCRIRRVDSQGMISTIAGSTTCGESGDGGPAAQAKFGGITDITTDPAGDVYVGDRNFSVNPPVDRVREIRQGVVTTVAGGGSGGDGTKATNASIEASAVGIDDQGDLLIVSNSQGRVHEVGPNGILVTIAGGGIGPDNGPAVGAELLTPNDVVVDPAGHLFITCSDARTAYADGTVREVSSS